jgi:hypothetical protein
MLTLKSYTGWRTRISLNLNEYTVSMGKCRKGGEKNSGREHVQREWCRHVEKNEYQ